MERKTAQAGLYFSVFLIVYFIFEACFISFISLGAGLDDAELISNLSFWNWGYGGSQPPLYTWLAYGLTHIFSVHFALLQFLRFGILASGFFALYISLRLLKIAPPLAAFACLSLFLLPQIGWESQRALIHSTLGTAGSAWSLAAFIWFAQSPNFKRAVLFGLAISVAVLGKYNGIIFIAALFMSGFILRPLRPAIASRYFAAAVASAFIFMAPALIFMALHPHGVVERAAKFQAGSAGSGFGHRLHDALIGLLDLGRAGFTFILPALALALIIGLIIYFGQKRRTRQKAANATERGLAPRETRHNDKSAAERGLAPARLGGSKETAAELELASARLGESRETAAEQSAVKDNNAAARRLLAVILLCGLGLCALMVLLSGATHIKDRWLQPVLFLAPAYACLWLAQLDLSGRAARAFGLAGLIAALFVPPMLYVNLYGRAAAAKAQNLDYAALYHNIRQNGEISTILAPVPFYAGNIRLIDPRIKTLFAETPFAAARLARPLVIMWKGAADERGETRREDKAELPASLTPLLAQAGIELRDLPPARLIAVPYRGGKGAAQRAEQIYYVYLP